MADEIADLRAVILVEKSILRHPVTVSAGVMAFLRYKPAGEIVEGHSGFEAFIEAHDAGLLEKRESRRADFALVTRQDTGEGIAHESEFKIGGIFLQYGLIGGLGFENFNSIMFFMAQEKLFEAAGGDFGDADIDKLILVGDHCQGGYIFGWFQAQNPYGMHERERHPVCNQTWKTFFSV